MCAQKAEGHHAPASSGSYQQPHPSSTPKSTNKKRFANGQAKVPSIAKDGEDSINPLPNSRPSSPHTSTFVTPRSKMSETRDKAYWSFEHPDARHSRRHHHSHHHHHIQQARVNGYQPHPYSPYNDFLVQHSGRHHLSRDNRSLQDVTVLTKLIDDRTGWHEEKRVSDDFIKEAVRGKKNGSGIRAYYERLNTILDGWREVDMILDSEFPEEVMRRFGTIEEVQQFNQAKRKRLPWLEGGDSEGEDSGYQEESEVESEDDERQRDKRRESLTARAASALSGFWFGASSSSKDLKAKLLDEESALTASSPQAEGRKQRSRPSYGATNSFKAAGTGLSTIPDSGETSPPATKPSTPSQPEIPQVQTTDQIITAVENNPEVVKEQAKIQSDARKGRNGKKSIIQQESNSDTDDEMDTSDFASDPVKPGSLDKKLAMQREDRKSRSKIRDVVVPGTGGAVARLGGRDTSDEPSSRERITQNKSKPGGQSERERIRLLEHVPGRAEREDERERGASFAININLAVNVLLLAGKVFAVISSNSVSLLASLVDSALDLLSTIIIFGTSKAIAYRSWHTYFKYPVGKKRFEPLGVVIFSVLMIASFCQVLVESSERLWSVLHSGSAGPNEAQQLPLVGIAFMVLTIIVKAFMWIIYRRSPSSGVRAVAQDAENDVVFNVASLIFPVVGSKLGWPALDPIGGVLLSIYIIWEWIETLAETVTKLSGAAASPDAITRALYLITRFRSVDSVSALELYHAGDDVIVEADVVLPLGLALKEAHDLGEIVTYCLESIGHERAFVHLDYNPLGQRGHISERG